MALACSFVGAGCSRSTEDTAASTPTPAPATALNAEQPAVTKAANTTIDSQEKKTMESALAATPTENVPAEPQAAMPAQVDTPKESEEEKKEKSAMPATTPKEQVPTLLIQAPSPPP